MSVQIEARELTPGDEVKFPASGRYHRITAIDPSPTRATLGDRINEIEALASVEDWWAIVREAGTLANIAHVLHRYDDTTDMLHIQSGRGSFHIDRRAMVTVR